MDRYQSTAAEEHKQVATGKGVAYSIAATNLSGSARYLFVFDGVGAVTRIAPPVLVSPGETVNLTFEDLPVEFTAGLYLAASSTQSTFTASGANDFDFHVEYSVEGGRVARRTDLGVKRRA